MQNEMIPQGRLDRRFWKQDLKAGFILSFMSVAFGIGIAAISHFPLQAGLVSAVVAPLVLAFYGGSFIVVCGSAAALAPILAMSVNTLGQGDDILGYQRTLAVIVCTAPIMYLIGRFRRGTFMATLFSHSVTAGLLAAIAVILALGRLPAFTGLQFDAKGIASIAELARRLGEVDLTVAGISLGTFLFLAILTALKGKLPWLKAYPPQLLVLPLLFLAGWLLPLSPDQKINIPENLMDFHRWPDFNFGAMWVAGVFWYFVYYWLVLSLVDSIESVATVLGIDRLDRYRRTSNVDRVVSAMGIANFLSGFLGGLSNIPGGAKSTMSAAVGTVTAWTSIFGALFVIIEVILGRGLINLLPQAGLAMVIVFTVGKLIAVPVWKHFWQVGFDQFIVFFITFGMSVATGDILKGIIAGVFLQVVIALWFTFKVAGPHVGDRSFRTILKIIWQLWSDPAVEVKVCPAGQTCDVYLSGVWVFFKNMDIVFRDIPSTAETVRFHLTDEVLMVDQPTMERLRHYVEIREGELHVAASLRALAAHSSSTRLARR